MNRRRKKYNLVIQWLAILLLVQSAIHPVAAQDVGGVARQITDHVTDFELDNLGNIYLVNDDGRIKKLTPAFDSAGIYNQVRQFGELHSIDASNPLKLLLFYKDFATVVILDRFLNDRATVDLRRAGILQPAAIAQSFDNNIWVWDDLDSRLLKVSDGGEVLLSSPDLRITFDEPPQPQILIDYNRNVYAYDSLRGLLVWDYYGAYKSLLPFTKWQHLHNAGKGIAGVDHEQLIYYDPSTPLPVAMASLPSSLLGIKKMRLSGDRLFVLQHNGQLLLYAAKSK